MNLSGEGKRMRRRRLRIAYALLLFFAGLACIFMPRVMLFAFSLDEVALAITGYFSVGAAVTFFVYLYLVGDINFRPLDTWLSPSVMESSNSIHIASGSASLRDVASAEQELRNRIAQLSEEFQQLKKGQVAASMGDRDALLDAIRPTLVEDVAKKVGERIAESLPKSIALKRTRAAFSDGSRLLDEEVRALSKRSAVNLAIGGGITCVAASLLVVLIWGQADAAGETWPDMVHFYIPRLATVVFVEVFGFFFLRQYKATLLELRACRQQQIELIAKFSAVELGWASEESTAKASVAARLIEGGSDRLLGFEKHSGVDSGKLMELLSAFAKAVGKNGEP